MTSAVIRAYRQALDFVRPSIPQRLQTVRFHHHLPRTTHPQSFNEHMLRVRLRWQDDQLVAYSDKVAAKATVADVLGCDWVTPTLWSGRKFPEVRGFTYPYVMKAIHGSGLLQFVRRVGNEVAIRAKASKRLDRHTPRRFGEPWYNRIEPLLLVEPMLGDGGAVPADCKFFCLSGQIACTQFDTDRFSHHRRCFYSPAWGKLPFEHCYPFEPAELPRPKHLEAMLTAAATLSDRFEFVRVDLYDLADGPRFGEMTFCPDSAWGVFRPTSADYWLGDFWGRGP